MNKAYLYFLISVILWLISSSHFGTVLYNTIWINAVISAVTFVIVYKLKNITQ